jgi:hypothetical protein
MLAERYAQLGTAQATGPRHSRQCFFDELGLFVLVAFGGARRGAGRFRAAGVAKLTAGGS